MTVADLKEGECGHFCCLRRSDDAEGSRHAAGNGPEHAGAGPRHALQHLAAADAVAVMIMVVIAHRSLQGPPLGLPGLDRAIAGFIPACFLSVNDLVCLDFRRLPTCDDETVTGDP